MHISIINTYTSTSTCILFVHVWRQPGALFACAVRWNDRLANHWKWCFRPKLWRSTANVKSSQESDFWACKDRKKRKISNKISNKGFTNGLAEISCLLSTFSQSGLLPRNWPDWQVIPFVPFRFFPKHPQICPDFKLPQFWHVTFAYLLWPAFSPGIPFFTSLTLMVHHLQINRV